MMPRRVAITLLGATLAVATAGCGVLFRGTIPARELYRLTMPDSMVRAASLADGTTSSAGDDNPRPTLAGTLAILPYETPGIYGEATIAFRTGESAYGVYPNREWALPLGDMLGHATATLAAGHFTREAPLYSPPSPRTHTYLWKARVREFEEVDRGSQLLVAVRLDASLVRARDDSVLWSSSARRELPVTGGSEMSDVVRTLSAAAASTIAELVDRADRDLARSSALRPPAADTARRTP